MKVPKLTKSANNCWAGEKPEDKEAVTGRWPVKKMFLKKTEENTCTGISFY